MAKVVLDDLSTTLANSAAATLNANNTKLEAALEKTLSRDGTGPNHMEADFDLNHNDILNVDNIHADVLVLNGQTVTPVDLANLPATVMMKPIYDPTGVNGDAFDLDLMHGQVNTDQIEESAVTNPKLADGSVNDIKVSTTSALSNRIRDTLSPNDPSFGADGGLTDDRDEIQATWEAASVNGKKVGMYLDMNSAGELTVKNNITVEGVAGSILKQTDFSATGSFISNLDPNSSSVDSIKSNIYFERMNISGEDFPDPIYASLVAGSTTTTIVLPVTDTLGNPISTADDFYVGQAVNIMEGAAQSGALRIITDYVGSTRTATLSSALGAVPAVGDDVAIGWNDNAAGFAAGVTDIGFTGGTLSDYDPQKQVPFATGGKGLNFEQGVTNGYAWGQTFRNLGTAVFVQGLDGSFTNGAKKRAVGIRVGGYHAHNCGSVLTLAGINSAADPDGDADDSLVNASFITYENAGHNPWRSVGSDQQKSGILNFLEAQNVTVSHIRGRNDSTYPTSYPTDYPSRVGFGLTGNVGAMIWGWGRNLKVTDFVHHGNIDNVIVVRRGRALGDDAGATGAPQNCFNWDFRGIEHHGVINEYVIRIDPTLAFRVANSELTGNIEVAVNGGFVTLGLVDPNMSTFSGITLSIRDHVGGKTIIGTPQQIIAAGNTFASFGAGVTDLRKVDRVLNSVSILKTATIADDSVFTWTVPAGTTSVELIIHQAGGSARGHLIYLNGSWNIISQATTLIETSTAVLTGVTGTDTKVTVSLNGTTIYIENRLGAAYTPFILPRYYG